MTSGIALKLARTAKRVKAKDLAPKMGVLPPRITQIEMQAVVTDELAHRYLTALATFPDVVEPQVVTA